jgi:hypothetical protein
MKKNYFLSSMMPRPMSGPEMAGQTVRNGRLINTGYNPNGKTGIQKLVDMKNSMKRAEKVSIMSEAMIIAERVSESDCDC